MSAVIITLQPFTSPSSRGRGLKSFSQVPSGVLRCVALFTRAWIEITPPVNCSKSAYVALFTRAWIEISLKNGLAKAAKSPSSRGRGLK